MRLSFNPRAREGRDRHARHASVDEFQSTRPRGARPMLFVICSRAMDVSIHAPRVGRDPDLLQSKQVFIVSIHAPRVGRDPDLLQSKQVSIVSIHAPRVGRDQPCPEAGFP